MASVSFLISSPQMSCCRSNVRLFGATYSANAVSMDRAMKVEMTGRFMTFGKARDMGTTLIEIFGNPIKVHSEVFMLVVRKEYCPQLLCICLQRRVRNELQPGAGRPSNARKLNPNGNVKIPDTFHAQVEIDQQMRVMALASCCGTTGLRSIRE